MRRALLALLLTSLATTLAVPAHASDFEDFRIPDHATRRWLLTGSGSAYFDDGHGGGARSQTRFAEGVARSWSECALDGESRSLSATLDLYVVGNRDRRQLDQFDDLSSPGVGPWFRTQRRSEIRRDLQQVARGSVAMREYPWASPWGVELGLSGLARWSQYWASYASSLTDVTLLDAATFEEFNDLVERRYEYEVQAGAGFGYGRVRDASGVYLARLLESRLAGDGALARAITPRGRQRLAALFYTKRGFASPHEFPDRHFWGEVERLLREDGAIGEGGLGAGVSNHALEPVAVARDFPRRIGWWVGARAAGRHQHLIIRADLSSLSRRLEADTVVQSYESHGHGRLSQRSDAVLVGPAAEFHRPLGLRLQFDAGVAALFDVEGADGETRFESYANLGYLVDERWFLSLALVQYRRLEDRDPDEDVWGTTAAASAAYHLVDRWWLRLGMDQRQSRPADVYPFSSPEYSRSTRMSLAVEFRRGALDAPGLVEPVRPMH